MGHLRRQVEAEDMKQTEEEIRAWIEREVADAPPLRPEQRARIARLLAAGRREREEREAAEWLAAGGSPGHLFR